MNRPMLSADANADAGIRFAAATPPGYDPAAMWARLSSQISSPSPGRCTSAFAKWSIAARAPRGSASLGSVGASRQRSPGALNTPLSISAWCSCAMPIISSSCARLSGNSFSAPRQRLLEPGDGVAHAAVVGVQLSEDDVGLDHVHGIGRRRGSGGFHRRRELGHRLHHLRERLAPRVADRLRVHVPVVARLRRFLQDGVGFGEAVHADGGLHRTGGADAGNLARAQATAAGRGFGQLRDAEPDRQADDPGELSRRERAQRVAQLGAQFGERDRTDEPAPRGGRIDRLGRRQGVGLRTAPQTLEHAARRGFGADDDETERNLTVRRPRPRGLCAAAIAKWHATATVTATAERACRAQAFRLS